MTRVIIRALYTLPTSVVTIWGMEGSNFGNSESNASFKAGGESIDNKSDSKDKKSSKSEKSDKKDVAFGVKSSETPAKSEAAKIFGELSVEKPSAENSPKTKLFEAKKLDKLADDSVTEDPADLPETGTKTQADSKEINEQPGTVEADDTPFETKNSLEEIEEEQFLSPEESQFVAGEIVDARQNEVEAEQTDATAGSQEQMIADANAALLDALQVHLDAGEETEAALSAATEETLNDLANTDAQNQLQNESQAEHLSEDSEPEEPENTTPPTQPAATPPTPPIPPTPPLPPFGPNQSPNPNDPGDPNNPGGPNLTSVNALRNPNAMLLPIPVPIERRGFRARDALAGGIVGYLLGRRRGRKKSEKELLPIQHKLEKQVDTLQSEIAHKEALVRKAAKEQFSNTSNSVTENYSEQDKKAEQPKKSEQAYYDKADKTESPKNQPSEHAEQKTEQPNEFVSNPVTQENSELPEFKPVLEQIQTKEVGIDWSVRPFLELLAFAELIKIHDKNKNRNVRQLFERGEITKEEVRRLVIEYARGVSPENLRPVLVDEFEVDPTHKDSQNFETEPTADKSDMQNQSDTPTEQATTMTESHNDSFAANELNSSDDSQQQSQKPADEQKNPYIAVVATTAAVTVAIAILLFLWLN